MLCTVIVITGLCDLVKTVVDLINESSEVPNYQIISPIVLLLSAVSVSICVHSFVCIHVWSNVTFEAATIYYYCANYISYYVYM